MRSGFGRLERFFATASEAELIFLQ